MEIVWFLIYSLCIDDIFKVYSARITNNIQRNVKEIYVWFFSGNSKKETSKQR